MPSVFPYEVRQSNIFGSVRRPVAHIPVWSHLIDDWILYTMIVDTGADYTVLPKYSLIDLGVDPNKECIRRTTTGVGGKQRVYFLKKKAKIRLHKKTYSIPVGFLDSNDVPPLLGREGCLNLFRLTFANFSTEIHEQTTTI